MATVILRSTGKLATQQQKYLALATAVLLLAAGLRLWGLAETPPGLYYDEAGHLLSAQSIGREGHWPVYFEWGEGNDPLLAYLAALNLALLGPVHWAGRLVVAWAGVLSIAATMRAGRELFPRRWIGPLAGVLLATWFWHVNLSRYGIQPMLAGFFAPAAVAALWNAAHTGRQRMYALAGLWVGLGLVAYVGYRIFAAGLLLAGLALWLRRPAARGSLLRGGLLAGSVALALFSPLAVYFWQNPEWLLDRFRATTTGTLGGVEPGRALLANTARVVAGLFTHGSEDQRQNIAGRPGLDFIQAALLLAGIFHGLRRLPIAYGILLLWSAVGLLPSVLTDHAPSFQRAVMATPALALLAAAGAEAITRAWTWQRAGGGVMAVALAASAAINVRDYFGRWATSAATYRAYDGPHFWMARELRAAQPGAALYETPVYREWPTFAFALGAEAYQRFRSFNGRECLVVPAVTTAQTVYGVMTSEDQLTLPALQEVFPGGRVTGHNLVGGTEYAVMYEVPAGQTAQIDPATPLSADFGGLVHLAGFDLAAAEVQPGATLRLTLNWRIEQQTPADLKSFLHLLGPLKADGSRLYAQRDAGPCDNSYPSWQWAPGEAVIERVGLPIPAGVPAGDYQLQVGWYDGGTLQRLPVDAAATGGLADAVPLATVTVAGP